MMRLFQELQVARYNELYYGSRAASARKFALAMNLMSAIASCGALTGMLNGVPMGPRIIAALTIGAAVCASIGPLLNLEARAARFETAAFGHGVVRDRIKRLLGELKLDEIRAEHYARDQEIESMRAALSALDESPDAATCEQAWAQTEREFPAASAWNLV